MQSAAERIPPSCAEAVAEPGNGLCVLSSRQSKWAKYVNMLQCFAEGIAQCRAGTVSLEKQEVPHAPQSLPKS